MRGSGPNKSLQYYAYLSSINQIIARIRTNSHELKDDVLENLFYSLPNVAYIDIDYENASRTVVLTAMWPDATNTEGWSEEIRISGSGSVVEVGVLNHEANSDPEDVQFGGFLSVLGEDEVFSA